MVTGEVVNEAAGAKARAEAFSEYTRNILASGGIKPLIKRQLEKT